VPSLLAGSWLLGPSLLLVVAKTCKRAAIQKLTWPA